MSETWDGEASRSDEGAGEFATFDRLLKKPRRVAVFTVHLPGDDGEPQSLKVRFRAISPKAYDALLAEHPPSKADKEKGAQYNPDTFPPALIAAVSDVPRMTVEQVRELTDSEEWSGGEVGTLFLKALQVCNQGLDIPFTARG